MFIKDFANRRLIATPIAGLIAWCVVAVGSLFLEPVALSLLTFAATGSIVYLGLLVSKFTGENFLDKSRPKNTFDNLFMLSVGMAVLVYAIATPFFFG